MRLTKKFAVFILRHDSPNDVFDDTDRWKLLHQGRFDTEEAAMTLIEQQLSDVTHSYPALSAYVILPVYTKPEE